MNRSIDFVESALSEQAKPGHIVIRSSAIQKLYRLYTTYSDSELEQRQFIILKSKLFKVLSVQCYCTNIPTLHYFSLCMFPNLIELRLDMCPPSTIDGLYAFKHQIQVLEIANSGIPDLSRMIVPYMTVQQLSKYKPMVLPGKKVVIPEEHFWPTLSKLRLSNCGIAKLDESFHFLPSVTAVDLSKNDFSHVIHLQDCCLLKLANLSHNRIRVLSNLDRVLGNITSLNIAYNFIQSLDGIDKIYSLQRLDVSGNLIDDFCEVHYLNKLPCLEAIDFDENPIASDPNYRLYVYTQFILDGSVMQSSRPLPALDGQMMSFREQHALRGMMFRVPENDQRELSQGFSNSVSFVSGDDETAGGSDTHLSLPVNTSNSNITDSISRAVLTTLTADSFGPAVRLRGMRRSMSGSALSCMSGQHKQLMEEAAMQNTLDNIKRRRSNRLKRLANIVDSGAGDEAASPGGGPPSPVKLSNSSSNINNSSKSFKFPTLDEAREAAAAARERWLEQQQHHHLNEQLADMSMYAASNGADSQVEKRGGGGGGPSGVLNSATKGSVCPSEESSEDEADEAPADNADQFPMDDTRLDDNSPSKRQAGNQQISDEDLIDSAQLPIDVRMRMSFNARKVAGVGTSESELGTYLDAKLHRQKSRDSRSHRRSRASKDGRAGSNSAIDRLVSEVAASKNSFSSSGVPGVLNLAEGSSGSFSGNGAASSTAAVRVKIVNPSSMMRSNATAGTSFSGNANMPETDNTVSAGERARDLGGGTKTQHLDASTATLPVLLPMAQQREYTGDEEYGNLTVMDNLELYFREQVFGVNRPSGKAPYIRVWQSKDSSSSSEPLNNGKESTALSAAALAACGPDEVDIEFVQPMSVHTERLAAIFSEKFIALHPTPELKSTLAGIAAEHAANVAPVAPASSIRASLTFTGTGRASVAPNSSPTADGQLVGGAGKADGSSVIETPVVLVLTDCSLYVVSMVGTAAGTTFNDAPVPVLISAHLIFALRKCTIFFGFQRCVLTFADTDQPQSDEKLFYDSLNKDTDDSTDHSKSFVIITRDKGRTYPIITQMPKVANASRVTISKTLRNVKISNKDAQLMDMVCQTAHTLGVDADIVHYQMLFQVWRNRPGYSLARTFILTPQAVMLCEEDLTTVDVRLTVIDSAHLRDIIKIIPEENPLMLTFVFKPVSMFATRRKWRLLADSRTAIARLNEECRRACIDNGNTDI